MTHRVSVAPGDGIALARDGVVAVVLEPQQHPAGTSALLELARSQAGEQLLRSAALLVMHRDDLPAFGLIIGALADATLLLHGDIAFHAVVDGMDTSGRGAGAHEWVERTLPGPAEWIGIGAAPQEPPDGDWWDLKEGSSPASTAWLISTARAAEVTVPPPPPPPPPPGVVLVDLTAAEATIAPRAPLPQAEPAALVEDDPDDDEPVVIVRGVRCPDDHHNNPDASYCSLCGRRMGVSRSLVLVDGPRPPLGVLIVDDGATIPVRSDMVIGRSPGDHALVADGHARAVTIDDSAKSISRAHVHVRLDQWDVVLDDLGSSNGTFVWDEQASAWIALTPGEPRVIEGRQRIRMGDREMHFAPHHVAS